MKLQLRASEQAAAARNSSCTHFFNS